MNYLDKLLEGVDVEWKTLGMVAKVGTGSSNGNEANENGEYPFFVRSQKIKTKNAYEYNEEAIIIPGEGGIGDIYHYIKGKYALHQRVYRIHFTVDFVDTRFIYYYMSTHFKGFIMRKAVSATVTSIRKPMIESFLVPIPPLEIQQKIVAILDSFTELIAKLTAELTVRKQQYTYYREQFFVFDKKKVQHLPMEDESIGVFQRGKRFVKTDLISEGVPVIHYGEMYTHYGTWAEETKSFLSEELVKSKNLRVAQQGDVVIVAAGETIEDIGKGTAWLGNEGVVIHDACFSFRTSLNTKFVAYFTRTKQFHDQIKKHISSGKISAINAKGLGKAIIPVPSKEVQENIVSILDKFDILTNSSSEGLPKEIELRKKQYEYYRDLLLTFHKDN
jgi:type I restriction enzyme, S subunit